MPDFTNSANIVNVDFSYNNFTGEIPLFNKLNSLQILEISNNNLSGSLTNGHFPSIATSSLRYLHVALNSLTGTIPPAAFSQPNVYYISLSLNSFTGGIPTLSSVSTKLTSLWLGRSVAGGSVSSSLWNIPSLQIFVL